MNKALIRNCSPSIGLYMYPFIIEAMSALFCILWVQGLVVEECTITEKKKFPSVLLTSTQMNLSCTLLLIAFVNTNPNTIWNTHTNTHTHAQTCRVDCRVLMRPVGCKVLHWQRSQAPDPFSAEPSRGWILKHLLHNLTQINPNDWFSWQSPPGLPLQIHFLFKVRGTLSWFKKKSCFQNMWRNVLSNLHN